MRFRLPRPVGSLAPVRSRRRSATELLEQRCLLAAIAYESIQVDQLGGSPFMLTSDLDGDGDNDLVSGVNYRRYEVERPQELFWRPNVDGRGTFGPARIIAAEANSTNVMLAGDMDGDGDMDLVAGSDRDTVWYENRDGHGLFGPGRLIHESMTQTLSARDIDNDGDLDLLHGGTVGQTEQLSWFENSQDGIFTPHTISNEHGNGWFVDLDSDGDPDVISRTRSRSLWGL